jgi:hypothetical protein
MVMCRKSNLDWWNEVVGVHVDDTSADFQVAHSYFSRDPIREEGEGSYADSNARMEHTVTYGWNHTFSEIFTSLLSAGLRIDFLHEFPFCAWDNFSQMVLGEDKFNRMKDPQKEHMIPMTFSLKATKPM